MSWTVVTYIDSEVVERVSEGDRGALHRAIAETDQRIRDLTPPAGIANNNGPLSNIATIGR